jgi:aspartate 1-decarboxylase
MLRALLRSKLHRLTVTDRNIEYEGSLTIDSELLTAADILPGERVQVVNINNGARFETYILKGVAGSGEVCLNGAAARLAEVGDIIIVIAYGYINGEEARSFKPKIVLVDQKNKLRKVT